METVNISDFADLRMECACTRTHTVSIKHIHTGKGAINRLADVLENFKNERVFLVGDKNTMPLARESVNKFLVDAGCEVTEHVFEREKNLVLDEQLIGSMLVRMPQMTGLIVTIGSGTLNDLSRVIATRTKLPWVIIGTAPSMDGYASTVSPIAMEGTKRSVPLGVPYAILADSDLLCTAPDEMLSSGVGDILGKYVALCDWQLATRETGEYYCDYITDMIYTAAGRCANSVDNVKTRDAAALSDMADTLILSGLAISMHGLSRPASGCEHQLAHYWEVALHGKGPRENDSLHGNYVALATEAACRLYELAAGEFDMSFSYFPPKAQWVKEHMALLGDYSTIKTLGVTRELFYESFFHATESNKRYTLIMFLEHKGRLEHYARILTDEFFA